MPLFYCKDWSQLHYLLDMNLFTQTLISLLHLDSQEISAQNPISTHNARPPRFSDLPSPLSLISHQSSIIVPTSDIKAPIESKICIIRADGSDFKLQKSCYCYYVRKRKKNCLLTFKVNENMKALEYYILKKKC